MFKNIQNSGQGVIGGVRKTFGTKSYFRVSSGRAPLKVDATESWRLRAADLDDAQRGTDPTRAHLRGNDELSHGSE
jgi:hypothetical protein